MRNARGSPRAASAASSTLESPCAIPTVPTYVSRKVPRPIPSSSRNASFLGRGENASVSTPFFTIAIFLPGMPRSERTLANELVSATIFSQ